MKLINNTRETKAVLDAGDGQGRTVAPGAVADFTEQGARELIASFPSDWAPADVETPIKKSKEGAK